MSRLRVLFGLIVLAGMVGAGLLPTAVHGQTGPGGVDDTDATNNTDLRIWLRADENVDTNADGEVTGWANLVGGTAETAVNGAPTLETGALGGKPVVQFNEGVSNVNNATDYLDYNTVGGQNGNLSGNNTLIVVSKNSGELFNIFNQAPIALGTGDFPDSGNPDGRGLVYSLDTKTGGDEVALAAVNGDAKGQGNDALSGDVAADLTYNVTPFRIFSSVVNTGGGGSQDLLANGEVLEPAGNATGRTKSTARVGERLIGEVAEVIVLDRQVNAAELTIIHNYLSTKYGVSLANAVPDRYEYDSGHPGEVAGVGDTTSSIGNAPAGATTTAQSSGLYLDAAGSLNADAFALYGHNNANFAFTAIEPPNGRSNVQKLAREWRVDLTNADFTGRDTVEVGLDETALATSEKISSTSDYNDYFLYVDSDGDFSDGNATAYDLTNRGNRLFTNTGVEISDGDYVTVARVKRTLSFTKALGSGFEDNAGTVSVTAQINFKTDAQIDVSASADPLKGDPNLPAATRGDDFTDNGATWSFPAGTTEDSPNVFTVEPDGANEPTELLKVTPGSYPTGLAPGDTTQFEYSILDQDNTDKIEFASGNPTSTMEGNMTVTFDVKVSNSGSGTAFFDITGGATAGEDYEIKAGSDTTRGEVSLSGGTGSFNITILDDNISEASESLEIELYAAKNGATLRDGGALSQTFTINDNDGVPSVSFTSGSYSGDEGTDVDVTLSLDASAGQDLDVKVKDDGSGDADSTDSGDYAFSSPKTVTVPSGNTEKTFSVTLKGDGTVEPTETIGLSIVDDADTEPNLSTTNPTATTIFIQDNSGVGKVGPGGVGNSSSLSLWLQPDEGVTTDANGITSWADQSGNGNDATQVDDAEKPGFGSTMINGIQVATFDGSDDFLRTNISSLPSSSHTLFSVSDASAAGTIFGIDNGSYEPVRTLEYGPNINTARAFQDGSQTGGVATGGVSILTSEFDGSNVNIRANGRTANTGAGANANGSFSFVGAEVQNSTGDPAQPIPAAQNPFNGDLGEIIAYNQTLNKAQRLIVENYLAAKYAISSDSLSKDLYAGDLGADGTEGGGDDRDTDVLGVGQADNGDKHFTASAGGLTISVAGGADTGEYVFAGRKIGVNQRINVTDTSTVNNIGVTARLNDDRYIDVTDDGGTTDGLRVDLTFDFDDIGVRGPAGDVSDYVLLQRADTSGSWTKITPGGGVSSSGSTVTFANVSLSDADDGYFTIGTKSSSDSPLDTRYASVGGEKGDEAPNNTGSNSNGGDAGYLDLGLPITGGTAGSLARPDGTPLFTQTNLGYTGLNSNTAILYRWDYTNQQYTAVTDTSTVLPNGRGFTLWVKDNPVFPVKPELNFGLQDVSNAPTSNVEINLPNDDGRFVYLANPYLSAYDMTAFTDLSANGFQATILAWDPDNGGRYGSYVPMTQGMDDDIARYQGFFIERSTQDDGSLEPGATTLTFDNTGRITDQNVTLVGTKSAAGKSRSLTYRRLELKLSALDGSGDQVARDVGASVVFLDRAQEGWDAYDAPKYRPPSNRYATIAPLGTGQGGSQVAKSQESRKLSPTEMVEIPLQLRTKNISGTFALSARTFESIPNTWDITLVDTKGTADPADDTSHDLTPSGEPYRFQVASKAKTRTNEGPPTPGDERSALPRPRAMKATDGTPRFTLKIDPSAQPLPVELASLEARTDGQTARLTWTTASETNNAGFEVERKTETGFETVGFVEGAGTTEQPQDYRYRVEDLQYGSHTFRLRQVDQSGAGHYSKTVTTSIRLDEAYKVSTPYPNPFRMRATLEVTVRETQKVRVALYDVLGRRVKTIHDGDILAQKTRSIQVSSDRLSAGMYFLRVKGASFSEVRRVVHVE